MYGALDISVSGMVAQRTRLDVIAANLANADTLRDAAGNLQPFKRRLALFAPGAPDALNPLAQERGVHVLSIDIDSTPARLGKYDPDSPDAYKSGPYKGYVAATNVNPVVEQINALEAARAYEANVVAAETTKQMASQALRLLG